MAELFILAAFGHLIGDYLFQTKAMALRKSDEGPTGIAVCTVHAIVYTIAVCLMIGTLDPLVWVLIGAPHWIIDRWSLGNKWLKLIRGRTFEGAYHATDAYREFDIAFTCIVYTVVDNTFHLLSLWLVIRLFIL